MQHQDTLEAAELHRKDAPRPAREQWGAVIVASCADHCGIGNEDAVEVDGRGRGAAHAGRAPDRQVDRNAGSGQVGQQHDRGIYADWAGSDDRPDDPACSRAMHLAPGQSPTASGPVRRQPRPALGVPDPRRTSRRRLPGQDRHRSSGAIVFDEQRRIDVPLIQAPDGQTGASDGDQHIAELSRVASQAGAADLGRQRRVQQSSVGERGDLCDRVSGGCIDRFRPREDRGFNRARSSDGIQHRGNDTQGQRIAHA